MKDGKTHEYWSVIENKRVAGGHVVQRHVLYCGSADRVSGAPVGWPDQFWAARLPPNRKGTRWDQVLQVLVAYRLIAPGSEWKLHRDWLGKSAMADLPGGGFRIGRSTQALRLP